MARAAGATNTEAVHYGLADSGCGISTTPTDKYGCNTYWHKAGESRYSVQAVKGDHTAARLLYDSGRCQRHRLQGLSALLRRQYQRYRKPGIWQSKTKSYMFLTKKWEVPVVPLFNLPRRGPQKDHSSPYACHEKDLKGVVTPTFPSPTESSTYMRMEYETWLDSCVDIRYLYRCQYCDRTVQRKLRPSSASNHSPRGRAEEVCRLSGQEGPFTLRP
jgi:hypothetical protein